MAVLNGKVVFPVMLRLSPPLSWRTSPVPERPVTVPPTVNVVAPPPPPPPVDFGSPLHAAKTTEIMTRCVQKRDLGADFMAVVSPWLSRTRDLLDERENHLVCLVQLSGPQ